MKLYIERPGEFAPLVIDTADYESNPASAPAHTWGAENGAIYVLGNILTVLVELTNVAQGIRTELKRANDIAIAQGDTR